MQTLTTGAQPSMPSRHAQELQSGGMHPDVISWLSESELSTLHASLFPPKTTGEPPEVAAALAAISAAVSNIQSLPATAQPSKHDGTERMEALAAIASAFTRARPRPSARRSWNHPKPHSTKLRPSIEMEKAFRLAL